MLLCRYFLECNNIYISRIWGKEIILPFPLPKVGLIQSVKGLTIKPETPKEEGILPSDSSCNIISSLPGVSSLLCKFQAFQLPQSHQSVPLNQSFPSSLYTHAIYMCMYVCINICINNGTHVLLVPVFFTTLTNTALLDTAASVLSKKRKYIY